MNSLTNYILLRRTALVIAVFSTFCGGVKQATSTVQVALYGVTQATSTVQVVLYAPAPPTA